MGFAVDAIVDCVRWLGYTKTILKTDVEAAILKLLVEPLRELRIQGLEKVMSENSPEYDPQANGKMPRLACRSSRACSGHIGQGLWMSVGIVCSVSTDGFPEASSTCSKVPVGASTSWYFTKRYGFVQSQL